jgi:uncharacterized membrane protein YcaP (DUF421 family)
MAQLNTTDFIVLMAVANAVQNAIIGDETSVTGGVLGAATLFALNGALAVVLFRWPWTRKVVEGEETPLIEHGEVLWDNLRKERITREDLEVAIQRQNADDISEVERAVLEPGGAIVVKTRRDREEQTLADISRKLDEVLARLGPA